MKKKLFSLLIVMVFIFVAGCTKVEQGKYKAGTYFAFDVASKYTATVYVNEEGFIKSVLFDSIYPFGCDTRGKLDDSCTLTTKQALGDGYNMKAASPIEKEWYEQVKSFGDKVIEEQGMEWLEFKYRVMGEDGKYEFTDVAPEGLSEENKTFTDSVAGVTIYADNLSRLINDILEQAKNNE